MTFLEALVPKVGAAVAKSIAKLWLKDVPIAGDAAEGVIEAAKGKLEDFAAARGAGRLLDDLQFDVATRLDSLIQNEFTDLAPNDVNAAIAEVSAVLREPTIAESLVASNLNVADVQGRLRDSGASRFRSLGGDSERLAELLLRESCAYVISIANKLPNFEVAATRELLKRTDDLLRELRTTLDHVDAVRSTVIDHQVRPQAAFETDYRRSILLGLDRMELFGVRLAGGGARSWPLSVAYVTLSSKSRQNDQVSSVDVMLAGERALLVNGEAGSGKTTLLHWLAVRAAGRDFPTSLQGWNGLIPFYIRLRDYADLGRPLPTPGQYLNSCAPNLAESMPHAWVHEVLKQGALILLDGVDELPVGRRGELISWITALKNEYPKNVVIVTSRPSALQIEHRGASFQRYLQSLSFHECTLEPMSARHSAALVDQWHEAVGRDLGSSNQNERLQQYAIGLQRTLRERPAIQGLASNPLLCAMLCALNWDQKQSLPDDRMELYRLAINMLIHARDSERNVVVASGTALTANAKLTLIEFLAYWLLRNGYSEAPFEACARQLKEPLKRLGNGTDRREVLQTLLERSGVLRQPSFGVVDFVHRTFLEYLGARAAVDTGDLGLLAERSQEEGWRDVVVFAAGHARGPSRDRLVEGLLRSPWLGLKTRPVESDVTAVCCLETTRQGLDPGLRERLLACAAKLFPPREYSMARVLAPAAAVQPTWLAGHTNEGASTIAACIKCAALTPSQGSLAVIAEYAAVSNLEVQSELLSAWTAFDEHEYLESVVRRMQFPGQTLETLGGTGYGDFHRFLYLLSLEGLRMGSAEFDQALNLFLRERELQTTIRSPADTARVVAMSSVRTLSLLNCAPSDVQRLASLEHLRSLLCQCDPQHFEQVAHASLRLPALRSLTLQGKRTELQSRGLVSIIDLSVLSKSETLRSLRVISLGEPRLRLPYGTGLETLDIEGMRAERLDYEGMGQCSRLKHLRLRVAEFPWDAVSFSRLSELEELHLQLNQRSGVEIQLPNRIQKIFLSGFMSLRIVNPHSLLLLRDVVFERVDVLPDIQSLLQLRLRSIALLKVPYSNDLWNEIRSVASRGVRVTCDWL